MGFVKRMDQKVTKYWYPNTKMVVVPFVWMADVVIQGTWVLCRINNDKGDESLPLLPFRIHFPNVIFPKHSKEGRLSVSHLGIRNILSDVC